VKKKEKSAGKRRTVAWSEDVDSLAIALAAARGYYPEKTKGGVSRLLADLIVRAKNAEKKS